MVFLFNSRCFLEGTMMRRLGQFTLLVAALLLSAPAAQAQGKKGKGGRGFRMNNLMLITQKSVQEELKMTEDQVTKAQEALKAQFASFKGLKDLSKEERKEKMAEANKAADKAVADILKEGQVKRVKQIALQVGGVRSILRKEVASSLKLSDDQKEKIAAIEKDAGKEMRELFQGGKGEGTAAKIAALRKSTMEKAQGVLTDEQKKQWEEMTGAPFTGEIRFGFPGGGRKAPAAQGRLAPPPVPTEALVADRRPILSR
jgi:primosomal protein N'